MVSKPGELLNIGDSTMQRQCTSQVAVVRRELTPESLKSIKTGAYLLAVELHVPPGRPDHIHFLLDSHATCV